MILIYVSLIGLYTFAEDYRIRWARLFYLLLFGAPLVLARRVDCSNRLACIVLIVSLPLD